MTRQSHQLRVPRLAGWLAGPPPPHPHLQPQEGIEQPGGGVTDALSSSTPNHHKKPHMIRDRLPRPCKTHGHQAGLAGLLCYLRLLFEVGQVLERLAVGEVGERDERRAHLRRLRLDRGAFAVQEDAGRREE